jgi:hypothetical protein
VTVNETRQPIETPQFAEFSDPSTNSQREPAKEESERSGRCCALLDQNFLRFFLASNQCGSDPVGLVADACFTP